MERLVKITIGNAIIVAIIVILAYLLFKDVKGVFSSIMILAGVMFALPVTLIKYYESWKIKSLEDFFPNLCVI